MKYVRMDLLLAILSVVIGLFVIQHSGIGFYLVLIPLVALYWVLSWF